MPQGKKPEGAVYCPGGHRLPREGCTPLYCLDQRAGKSGKGSTQLRGVQKASSPRDGEAVSTRDTDQTKARKEALAKSFTALGAAPPEEATKEATRLSLLAGKHAARRGLVPVPAGLVGGDAEEYASKKLTELLPEAVANLEYDLKYGDDKQRSEAARDVLDANGMRKREGAGSMVSPIVLNFNGVLPWLQQEKTLTPTGDAALMKKVHAHAQIVDGEATRSTSSETGPDGDGPRRATEADGGRGKAR